MVTVSWDCLDSGLGTSSNFIQSSRLERTFEIIKSNHFFPKEKASELL